MNYFEVNTVLGFLMRIKAQTKDRIYSVNCKWCFAERTCYLCSKLDYELMTCLLNIFLEDLVLLHKSTGYEG